MGKLFKAFAYLFFLAILIFAGYLGYTYYQVTLTAESRIQKGAIDRVIASESPVYYDDGVTPIGVFFDKTHRRYVSYQETPKIFIKALLAAEDKNFFSHPGFDPKAILRALIANIRAGGIVQGGSTITQQTAKNIFEREKRSYRAKLKELVQAFLLERNYTKEEILEMYVNQFFVTGYGKGLGIAAQYFFDKEIEKISLVEAAFIAGSVKAPNRYNPFIKKNRVEKEKARLLAKRRKDYVLENMLEEHFISSRQYSKAIAEEVPFSEGKISYGLNVVLDYVREQLESGYFQEILQQQGIENIATSGIRIHTSINRAVQAAALKSLRRKLPLLDIQISGYQTERFSRRKREIRPSAMNDTENGLPFLARITSLHPNDEEAPVRVAWEEGSGRVDYQGLKDVAEAWLKWKEGKWARFERRKLAAFLSNLQAGDTVPVRLVDTGEPAAEARLELTALPELQGGTVVLHDGMVKAMAGGFFNRYFNRAADAGRQMGSIFKPLLFASALQLKWNTLDGLPNIRDLYRFSNTTYLPRPDHPPKSREVSMAWAGVKSENLACVWLLYHLTDHLNLSEFRRLAGILGLAREEDETYAEYARRIRDRYGILISNEVLRRAAFNAARQAIESDVIFSGYPEMLQHLRRLHLNIQVHDPAALENSANRQILRFSLRRLKELDHRMKNKLQTIRPLMEQYRQEPDSVLRERLLSRMAHFYRIDDRQGRPRIIYSPDNSAAPPSTGIPLTPRWVLPHPEVLEASRIWVDGLFTSEILELLQISIDNNLKRLLQLRPYNIELLFEIPDFRTLINLHYVVYLAKRLGIKTPLDPVLSFPLGPNAVTLMEIALAYQSIFTGNTYPLSQHDSPAMVPVIKKIADREGKLIWEYQPRPEKVLSPRVSKLVTEILSKVMQYGTGRSAEDAVKVLIKEGKSEIEIPVPTFGKTGTANDFTNAGFVGCIPGPDRQAGKMKPEKGYVIAAYVGYDDNRPMEKGNLRIYGSNGALPVWLDTAAAIVNNPAYREELQVADLVFSPAGAEQVSSATLKAVAVSPLSGLPADYKLKENQPHETPALLADVTLRDDRLEFRRRFEPLAGGAAR